MSLNTYVLLKKIIIETNSMKIMKPQLIMIFNVLGWE